MILFTASPTLTNNVANCLTDFVVNIAFKPFPSTKAKQSLVTCAAFPCKFRLIIRKETTNVAQYVQPIDSRFGSQLTCLHYNM